jgi:guanylate kinase
MIEEDDFIEWALVHGNYYGTSKSFVEETLDKSPLLLFDLDVQGTDAMKSHFGDLATAIFIAPPSEEELKRRLYGRGTDDDSVIELRLENSKKELKRKNDYDHCVVNDDLDRAYGELKDIVLGLLGER